MSEEEFTLRHDEKSIASSELGAVISETAHNFPDSRYWPNLIMQTGPYTIAGIDPSPYSMWATADGTGTKPKIAEALFTLDNDPSHFEGLGHDVLAMIEGDDWRFGRFTVGVVEILDVNSASNVDVVRALARGLKSACNEGHFALLNGETAELGYRTSGYGGIHVNWNAVSLSLVVPEKLILGDRLEPGQPIVALREHSMRSNGFTKIGQIMETAYLLSENFQSKDHFFWDWFARHNFGGDPKQIIHELSELLGHDFAEQMILPWHEKYPNIARQLLMPSRLYGPVIYEAQGGVDGPRSVDMIAAAHITGGGVPEKTKRMVEAKGLGVHIDPIFPDPEGIQSLLRLVDGFNPLIREQLAIDDASACLQWNRGIGGVVVTSNMAEAKKLIEIAERQGYEAGIAGEIIEEPKIIFRGHTWNYDSKDSTHNAESLDIR